MPSSHLCGNAEVFPRILDLHVPDGALVADVTYGRGVFWKLVDRGRYELRATDIRDGTDCRSLPYPDSSVDCVVLDPPYMEGLFRRDPRSRAGQGTHGHFRRYGDDSPPEGGGHAAVTDLYFKAGAEAWRVLKPGGVLIVKCQDEVSANKQRLTHVEIINRYAAHGFHAKDLFVVTRRNRAGASRVKRQVHARKNHSYFLVFAKPRRAATPTS